MNWANRITMGRIVLAIVTFVFLNMIAEGRVESWRQTAGWLAMSLFIVATLTDILDGYIARRTNSVSAFGRIADPFADKAIVCGCLIFLIGIPETAVYLQPWMVVVILIREFLVNGIRGYMESLGISFAAEAPGKLKMGFQSHAIGFLIGTIGMGMPTPDWLDWVNRFLVWSTVVLTIYSGAHYVIKASGHLKKNV